MTWTNMATVLVVEVRECSCGREYTCPNSTLMVRQRRDTKMFAERTTALKRGAPIDPLLSVEVRYIRSHIRRCPRCLTQYRPEGQEELFKSPDRYLGVQGTKLQPQEEAVEKPKKKRVTLADF